ncbi:unnamed protein product [Lepeophtheirus salmonis]|uniref:(salmon louse) hypothetical protein n=1 Tax=Lepeophtheirus salmonis TaxID=72036 RepID=A0A7R8CPF9_LEPSM|nr:unnamed protein product [Lepeophtheirus salmonis]CAF2886136.1 unnamed protein product [Lepeophtheirus salmonis]
MDTKLFYDAKPPTFLVLVQENPKDSDVKLSDDDECIDDPDYHPTQAEEARYTSFESMNEEQVGSTSTFPKVPPHRKRRGKNVLKIVSLAELKDTPELSLPPDQNKRKIIWKYEDNETFQVPGPNFEPRFDLKTPTQYFKTLFIDKMIKHIDHHTNLYSFEELGDPIKTSSEAIPCNTTHHGFSPFPAIGDYWHHE